MSQVFAVITLVGVGLYGLSTLFSSTPSTSSSSSTTNAQGVSTMAQNAYSSTNPYSLNNQTKYGGKSKRHKHKGLRLTRRKKY